MEPEKPSGASEEAPEAGGWWGSWITSAKSKSAEVYSMVKKDLDEIGSAVRSEASHVYSTTSSVIGKTLKLDEPESTANVMKKSLSTFIDQVNTVLNPEPDDEDTEVILSSGDTTMLSTYKKELEALQRVDATFVVPADSPELDAWRGGRERAAPSPAAAARRLHGEPLLSAQYERLVPDAVSHDDFWERYLFRVALLQDRLAAASRRRANSSEGVEPAPCSDPVLAHLPPQTEEPRTRSPEKTVSPVKASPVKASPVKASTVKASPVEASPVAAGSDLDEGVAWDDEDFASDVELTEEQQTLLLQEYEKEIASKKQNKTGGTKDLANNNAKNSPPKGKQKIETKKTSSIENKTKQVKTTEDKAKPIDRTKSRPVNQKSIDNKNKNVNKKTADKNNGKTKSDKSDICGNNLVEDHFDDKETQKVKDDSSSNSDESWEKEFEIEEQTT